MPIRHVTSGLALIIVLAASARAQTVLYVDAGSPPYGMGDDWAHAYHFLQDALSRAAAGDEIRVAAGTYRPDEITSNPTGTGNRLATFQLTSDVTIVGGYAGYGAPDPNARDIKLYESILSGDLNGDDDPADFPGGASYLDNSYNVVTGSGSNATAVLDGFTITGGHDERPSPRGRGGGMYTAGGSPTLRDCTFIGNLAIYGGGGMHNEQGSPTVIDCRFVGNAAGYAGGGVYNYVRSHPMLTNCVFSGNAADNRGGGMYTWADTTPTLVNCTFSGNSADAYGGGVFADGSPTLTNCILWGNTAPVAGNQVYGPTTTIAYSCIEGDSIGEGNITADPLFVDADGEDGIFGTPDDDVHLLPGSPCINAGNDDAVPPEITTDFEGDGRIQYCRVDMGADETSFVGPDCNANGAGDGCDVEGGISKDCNTNGIPDECETLPTGVIYVDDDASGGQNNGLSWADAHTRLIEALHYSGCSGDVSEIRVAGGVYTPGQFRTDTFQLVSGVAIRGGFRGLAGGGDPDDRDLAAFTTVLTGDLRANDIPEGFPHDPSYDDNAYHVVTGSGTDATAVLDGVTITAGRAGGGGNDRFGGGMFNIAGSPTLHNCVFSLNSAMFYGGGMYNYDRSSPSLTNCEFNGNTTRAGAGMHNGRFSNPILTNCVFRGNWADSDTGTSAQGGGMFNGDSSPTLTSCSFIRNSVTASTESGDVVAYGGGICTVGGSPYVNACAFIENSTHSDYQGRSQVSGTPRTAGAAGGAMFNSGSAGTVVNSTFAGNSSFAIYSGACTFCGYGLRAEANGGAMYNTDGSPAVLNCTFYGNSVSASTRYGGRLFRGGGVYDLTSGGLLANCIFWGNTAHEGPQIYGPAVPIYSCIQGGWAGAGNIDADPLFANGDLHLVEGSPCINAGQNAAVPIDLFIDIDGNDRILHCRVDMGADESPFTGVLFDCNANDVPDECDIEDGQSEDCNANFVPDECEADGCNGSSWCSDCNANAVLDECDIASGTSPDVNPPDGIPDDCQGVPCVAGACCLTYSCIVATESACVAAGGSYQSDQTTCDVVACPTYDLGDLDRDGDVDLDDFAAFQREFTSAP